MVRKDETMREELTSVVIYHGDCVDGFTAAWVAQRVVGDRATFIPARYGDARLEQSLELDCYENANLNSRYFILDFSFKRDLMRLLDSKCPVVVLDHHKTAQADCDGLPFCRFDMDRSGAGMAWDHFNEGQPRPWLVNYVEDRDLWRFALPHSQEVNALIRSTEQTFGAWDDLCTLRVEQAVQLGRGCLAHINAYVRAAVKHAFPAKIGQQQLPLVNITYESCSEVADALCQQGHDVAGYWFERGDGKIQYGLRSRGDFDCSVLAKQYGGGGHKGASGFVVDRIVHERM